MRRQVWNGRVALAKVGEDDAVRVHASPDIDGFRDGAVLLRYGVLCHFIFKRGFVDQNGRRWQRRRRRCVVSEERRRWAGGLLWLRVPAQAHEVVAGSAVAAIQKPPLHGRFSR